MKEFQYVITDPEGIHARPAGLLVKKANEFASNVTIKRVTRAQMLREFLQLWVWV